MDLAGQFSRYYRISRKGVKWWQAVFWWLFNETVTQAWILHKTSVELLEDSQKPPMTHLEFVKQLALELVNTETKTKSSRGRPASKGIAETVRRCSHSFLGRLAPPNQEKRRRLECKVCGNKTPFFCSGCNWPLHSGACWTNFHTRDEYKQKGVRNCPV